MGVIIIKFDFDIDRLQELADDFYLATGIRIYIISRDFSDIKVKSTEAYSNCKKRDENSDKSDIFLLERCRTTGKPQISLNGRDLVNIAAPIRYDSEIVGYVFFFILRQHSDFRISDGVFEQCTTEENKKYIVEQISPLEKKRYDSIIKIAVMLCEHLIITNMVKPSADQIFHRVKNFIKENLTGELSVEEISKGTNISKSSLYRLFAKHSGTTVSEYVNKLRAEQAAKLLLLSEMSISEIAYAAGFGSDTYFRFIFKKIYGCTPLRYRLANSRKEVQK